MRSIEIGRQTKNNKTNKDNEHTNKTLEIFKTQVLRLNVRPAARGAAESGVSAARLEGARLCDITWYNCYIIVIIIMFISSSSSSSSSFISMMIIVIISIIITVSIVSSISINSITVTLLLAALQQQDY